MANRNQPRFPRPSPYDNTPNRNLGPPRFPNSRFPPPQNGRMQQGNRDRGQGPSLYNSETPMPQVGSMHHQPSGFVRSSGPGAPQNMSQTGGHQGAMFQGGVPQRFQQPPRQSLPNFNQPPRGAPPPPNVQQHRGQILSSTTPPNDFMYEMEKSAAYPNFGNGSTRAEKMNAPLPEEFGNISQNKMPMGQPPGMFGGQNQGDFKNADPFSSLRNHYDLSANQPGSSTINKTGSASIGNPDFGGGEVHHGLQGINTSMLTSHFPPPGPSTHGPVPGPPFPLPFMQAQNPLPQAGNQGAMVPQGPRPMPTLPTPPPQFAYGGAPPGAPNNNASSGLPRQRNFPQAEVTESEKDAQWVDSFLSRCKVFKEVKQPATVSDISLPKARTLMREALLLLENLQGCHEKLLESIESNEEFPAVYKDAFKKRVRLQEIEQLLTSNQMAPLYRKMTLARKKRLRLKAKRQQAYMDKLDTMQNRKLLHQQADEWLDSLVQKQVDIKRENDLKESADNILGEVRKKLTETTKMKEVLTTLKKLRDLRKEAVERKGLYTPLDVDKEFDESTAALVQVLDTQEEIYQAEKMTLDVMLETEQAENEEKEREARLEKLESKMVVREKQIREMLFGKQRQTLPDDPLYPFRQFYDVANLDFDSFLQIRREWDFFVAPEGTEGASKLPVGWVAPCEPSSAIWASALKYK